MFLGFYGNASVCFGSSINIFHIFAVTEKGHFEIPKKGRDTRTHVHRDTVHMNKHDGTINDF